MAEWLWPSELASMRAYEYLHLIQSTGSMAGAAKEAGTRQPAVSAAIHKLEESLGCFLVDRRGRSGSTLTEQGGSVLWWYRQLARQAREFAEATRAVVRDPSADPAPYVIAASTTTSELLAPRWINLLKLGADVPPVSLLSTRSSSVMDLVRTRRADVGFIANAWSLEDLEAMGLESTIVGEDEIVVVVHPGHPWAVKGVVTVEELAVEAQVAREEGSGALEVFRDAVRAAGAPPIPIFWRANSSVAVQQAVVQCERPAALSSLAVADQLASGQLVKIEVTLPKPDAPGALTTLGPVHRWRRAIWRASEERTDLTRKLIDIARNNSVYLPPKQG